ncbi:MAG: Rieske 2Fe-2S domain-containing protein, partial [Pseudomonadota bacterium]
MSHARMSEENGASWPSNGLSEVPYTVYTDQSTYDREQELLYQGQTWNYLCLEIELKDAGDYVATTVGEVAVIAVRDRKGNINAFANRCVHRGNLLCMEPKGNVRKFSCIYHGWTYDLEGRLTGVAFENGVQGKGGMPPEFRKEEHKLRPMRVAVVGGIVFGTFSDEVADLETWLGEDVTRGIVRVMNRTPYILGRNTQVLPNNWKLYFENVKDTYHASILHLFLTTFKINKLTMPGGIYINGDGGNYYSYAKLDFEAESAAYEDEGLRSESSFQLEDNSIVDSIDEYGDGVSVQILSVMPGMVLQQVRNTIAIRVIRPRGVDRT